MTEGIRSAGAQTLVKCESLEFFANDCSISKQKSEWKSRALERIEENDYNPAKCDGHEQTCVFETAGGQRRNISGSYGSIKE